MERHFRVWAPFAKRMALVVDGRKQEMEPCDLGYWSSNAKVVSGHTEYFFIIDEKIKANDPRVRFLPNGQSGHGVYLDTNNFKWNDDDFKAVELHAAVFYELHVGTFSALASYKGVNEKLEYLKNLGITHIEFMPLGSFSSRPCGYDKYSGSQRARGWGYDPIFPFAPFAGYGHPFELMELVASCHANGLSVIIDLVFNHFGPSGSVQNLFGPYTNDKYKTPWGDAINFDGPYSYEVRRYVIDCALMWLRDYHFDGVRIDATHAIFDQSALSILSELNSTIDKLGESLGKTFIKIAESDLNNPRLIRPRSDGGEGFDAQWSDDFHHAIHAFITKESRAYYQDFGSLNQVKKALCEGFVYAGNYSSFRKCFRGQALEKNTAAKLITYTQNHDQVGNRAFGERLSHLLNPMHLFAMATINILSPTVPMLFQGEEWGSESRFFYFTSHIDERLAKGVFLGRKREFAGFFGADDGPKELIDPQSDQAFLQSKLDWHNYFKPDSQELWHWYRLMIEVRRRYISSQKTRSFLSQESVLAIDDSVILLTYEKLFVALNLSKKEQNLSVGKDLVCRLKAIALKGACGFEGEDLFLGPMAVGVFTRE